MRRYTILSAVLIAMMISGCKLIDKLTRFNVDYSTNFTIPSTVLLGLPLDIVPSSVTTNSDQTFSNNNTSADHIKSVQLSKLKLSIVNPSGQKFDFLKSAVIYISADGLPKVQVASIDNIDDSSVGSSIDLTPTALDLKDYLIKSSYTVSETVTTSKSITQNVDVRADAEFTVQGQLLK